MSFPSSLDDPARLALHLDPVGGIAGDMFVAAMIDALPWLEAPVLAELAAARPASRAPACLSPTVNGGLRALTFGTRLRTSVDSHDHAAAAPRADEAHAGTSHAELRDRIASATLSDATRRHALALLDLLADAEAAVHGIDRESVHFHELADWDSLLDLVAAGAIASRLEGASWTTSALPLGGGTIRTAHGVLPVPAPATTRLLEGYPWRDDGVSGERVTPTGAAILRHLAVPTANRTDGTLVATGLGAGTRTLPGIANVLRVSVFERATLDAADAVDVIEFDIDDMTGEEIALAAERLRSLAGVRDVTVGSRVGKKGRPVADFRLLVDPAAQDSVARACFTETSTLGLRVRVERRRILPREEVVTTAEGRALVVKLADRPGGARTAKVAHDDVASAAGLAQRRRLRGAGEDRVLDGDANG